jgi:signal transduction histidine kinase/ActR/RegA family two-component response regulator
MTTWQAVLPSRVARGYVAAVVLLGTAALVLSIPVALERPGLFAILLLLASLTSIWKVNLPIALASGSTLSVSYAANLMSLLLLGPRPATVIAVAGVWIQCTVNVKRPYPIYRTLFSMAAEAITMLATGMAYEQLGGAHSAFDLAALPRPLVGAIVTYFCVNTGLVAGAIGLSTDRSVAEVWRQEFLWSGASFFVAGGAGAIGAVVIDRGQLWLLALMIAPVYLTYRTYRVFVGRLEDQRQHREHLAVALADMTRLKELRNELLEREQNARASAEEANRLKDQFLAMVSHELRTPLNAILGWSDMLRTDSLPETRRPRAVQAIHESARQQARLIDELLDVSRIISGKLRLERSAVDWHDVVRGALEVTQPAADAKRVDLAVQVDRNIGLFSGDSARLQQIVWNLLTNAVKFTPEGGTVRVRLRQFHGVVELSVTDTGEGIRPDFLPSMFEPFRQADGSITRQHGGLGLGLAIVKHLVEAHGGTITGTSGGVGHGSTFAVRLPITSVYGDDPDMVATESMASTAQPPSSPASLEGISVLVVDDDKGSREVVAAYLEARHAAVRMAASAYEAIRILEQGTVDVLLADIAMPGQDGYQLIRAVRAMDKPGTAGVPAAALTAFARAEDRRQALDAGFQLHLTKPIGANALVAAVASLSRTNWSSSKGVPVS